MKIKLIDKYVLTNSKRMENHPKNGFGRYSQCNITLLFKIDKNDKNNTGYYMDRFFETLWSFGMSFRKRSTNYYKNEYEWSAELRSNYMEDEFEWINDELFMKLFKSFMDYSAEFDKFVSSHFIRR